MSKKKLYTELKRIVTTIPEVKYFGMYNAQYTQAGKTDHTNYPAVYVQFTNSEFRDLGGNDNTQDYDTIATLHVVFESYKIDAVEVFDLTEKIHAKVSHFEPIRSEDDLTHFGKLIWSDHREDADHDVLQIQQMDYKTKVRDYSARKLKYKTVTLSLSPTVSIVDEIT